LLTQHVKVQLKYTNGVKSMSRALLKSLSAAGLLSLGLGMTPAIAAPFAGHSTLSTDQSLLQTVQGYHRSCGWVNNGWFYSRNGSFVACRPRRPVGFGWGWRDEGGRSGWYHSNRRAWHFDPNRAR
jgi:hypothetical protein